MPHDMFADAVVRPISPRARRRRRLLTVLSIALHIVVVVPIAFAQALAVGPLPIPREPTMFEFANMVHLVEIPLPAPPPPSGPSAPVDPPPNPNAAPTVEPTGFKPEPIQPLRPTARYDVDGVPSTGILNGLPGVGGVPLPPPQPPQPQKPIPIHSGMQAPRKTVDVPPVYPPIAVASRKEGIVILEAILDARGSVESVRVLRSDPLLEQAAVDAVKQWKYTPALLNGVAVPVVATVADRVAR
jgi:protein TonB